MNSLKKNTSWSELDEARAQKAKELAEYYDKAAKERLAQAQKPYMLMERLLDDVDVEMWHSEEFLNDLYHIVHHKDLDEHKKMVSLQMLIDREYGDRRGESK